MLCSDVILPSVYLRAILGMQTSLLHASFSIVVPQQHGKAGNCGSASGGCILSSSGWVVVSADALGDPHADGNKVQSPFFSCQSLRATT